MSKQDTKQRVELVHAPLANEKPLFAPAFVSLMVDGAYETLRGYLEAARAKPEAIHLLDDMVLLLSWEDLRTRKQFTWIENQSITEALGSMTWDILELGGGSFLKK